VKVADTVWLAVIVRVQFPVPLQSPPQPAGLYPLSALATKVTPAPLL